MKWQAPTVLQSIHVVAEGDPNTHDRQGVAFSDSLLYGLTRGDADSLAPLDCQHYHGLLRGSPVGRVFPFFLFFLCVHVFFRVLPKNEF